MTLDPNDAAAPGPLHGFRVLDLSAMISGPLAAMVLGDQGADVIKVEPPGQGDFVRRTGTRLQGLPAVFVNANRNKRSIVINLKSERGIELLKQMALSADVLIQNFRPGAVERMGIGVNVMRAINPRLIYVSISGFGEKGPYAHRRVYDPIIQALSGLADVQADRETSRPRFVRTILPDKLTGITAAQAITAALLARERTGEGQHVRLAMLDAMVAFLWTEGMAGLTYINEDDAGVRPYLTRDLIYETTDGYITVAAMSDPEWHGLARVTGRLDWIEDPRFATAANRERNAKERLELTALELAKDSSANWLRKLEAEDVPCAPVLRREEVLDNEQLLANELLIEYEHPHTGLLRQPRPPARFEATPATIRRGAPLLGEHTDEILAELALDPATIALLREQGVVS